MKALLTGRNLFTHVSETIYFPPKKLPVATEISGNIHPEIIIDKDPLTPGVLSDDSSESASPHGLQILQQGSSGQRNKKIAKVKNRKTHQ